MSWRESEKNEFDPHGGRNAFRNESDNPSATERAASFRAMRSFTQSIEYDLPPAPELPPELDLDRIEGMTSSDTNDTIIEVVRSEPRVDPSLGETQKYKMSVPGPGHSDQENEMHKSLIKDEEEEEIDAEVEGITEGGTEERKPPSAFARHVPELNSSVDRSIPSASIHRRRPTTPTSQLSLESSSFVEGTSPVKEELKIKVSIPSDKRRRSEMGFSDFNESRNSQCRSSLSGRETPLNNYDGDILEENPEYKDKAPPHPVVHRRTSIEWENFEEMKEKMASTITVVDATQHSVDDEEPTFSEDMQEEREKLVKKKSSVSKPDLALEDSSTKTDDSTVAEVDSTEESAEQIPVEQEATMVYEEQTVPELVDEGAEPSEEAQVPEVSVVTVEVTAAPEEPSEQVEQTEAEAAFDPHGYPGYLWNYDTQQWEVDPTYDATQQPEYDYSRYAEQEGQEQPAYDYSQYQYDQTTGAYTNADGTPYNAGYDQQETYPQTSEYDYTTAAYHVGYDQTDQTAQEGYNQSAVQADYQQGEYSQEQPNYDQTHAGYDQGGYDTAPTDYQAGYEAPQEIQEQAYEAGYEHAAAGYDQNAYNDYYKDYPQQHQDNYDYTQYNQEYQNGEYQQGQESYYGEGGSYVEHTDNQEYTAASGYEEATNEQGYDASSAYTDPNQNVAEPEPVAAELDSQPHRPPPPAFITPMFKSAPPEHDPYSWEAQDAPVPVSTTRSVSHDDRQEESESAPVAAPSRPAPPTRPAPPQKQEEETTAAHAPPRPPPAAKPAPSRPQAPHPARLPDKEDDAWTQFKKMTEKVNVAVKSTEDQLKTLSETSAVNDIKDESYLAQIGGSQGYADNLAQREIHRKLEEQKNAKVLKKKMKAQGKKAASPEYDHEDEEKMDEMARQLAKKLEEKYEGKVEMTKNYESAISQRKRSSLKETQQDSGTSLELPAHLNTQQRDSIAPIGDLDPDDPILSAPAWADFDNSEPVLPPSESGFFSKETTEIEQTTNGHSSKVIVDPFAPVDASLIDEDYDPFAVQPAEELISSAMAKAEEEKLKLKDDVDIFGRSSNASTPTEGASPCHRPDAFDDEFADQRISANDTPLYDEDDSEPLTDFLPRFGGDGWSLMIRHPIKKKSFMAERCWKPCYVRVNNNVLYVFNSKTDNKPIQELLLQATYSLSDTTLQAYDIYGKIHTVKLQYVQYKEKVGIRPGQISRLVEGHITKYGLPLEHSAQCNVLLKIGSLEAGELQSFVNCMEDILFNCPARRETKPVYKQDEVQVHCYDEYSAYVDKMGIISDQKARVRLFCLAFLTGSPYLEIGLNDRRRQGKEIVRRKDILPMYTERWIRFENLEFHSTVEQKTFDEEQVIKLSPPDGCFFEIMRFRVRPPKNREKALNVTGIMKIAGSKVEIRLEIMAAAQIEKNRGGESTRRQIPCEDIAVRFPIPEAWIYLFREERHWGVGSVHSKKLRPGKVKNLKDRLLGAVQSNEPNLIEVAIGEAKYEHVYRSLVWRIPRLPEKHHAAYKAHLLRCRFELSSFDLMPETFLPLCEVDFTMPLATVSNTVVRSVSVEQHEDSDRVEKFVRYVAKCQYKVEIDYVQCADLDVDTMDPTTNPELAMNTVPEIHQPQFQPNEIAEVHDGYRIEVPDGPPGGYDSSSDEEETKPKMPIIQIDMKNYGY